MKRNQNWKISCEIMQNTDKGSVSRIALSFTTSDFQNFVPPDGTVVNFQIIGEVVISNSKLQQGIYSLDRSSFCLVTKTKKGFHLIAISSVWTKTRELLSKLLSSAGMEPEIPLAENSSSGEIISEWSKILRSIQ